jgi:hypothetical protein
MTLYFVVRTDVSGDSGAQRVFGAYDTEGEAVMVLSQVRSRFPGQFAVYKGSPT